MKKILVVLLVLAVAGGVFAQEGEFSFNGTAQVGAVVNFDPVPSIDSDLATSSPTQYNRLYDSWDHIKGELGINYSRDGFGAGLTFMTSSHNGGSSITADLTYGGENFNFQAQAPITDGSWGGLLFDGKALNALWGNYSFLDGLFFLEAAFVKAGSDFWVSDYVGTFRDWQGLGSDVIVTDPFNGDGKNTFTHTGGDSYGSVANYIVGDVRLQGLSFGLMMRNIFSDKMSWTWEDDVNKYAIELKSPNAFVDDVLRKMVFGVKFEMNPIEVAAQFLMEDYGVYLGGKWFIGPVTVGLSFMGILAESEPDITKWDFAPIDYSKVEFEAGDNGWQKATVEINPTKRGYKTTNNTKMKIGGGVNFDSDGYGAVIKGFFGIDGNKATTYTNQIGIEPGFYYNVIPTHLKFQLDAGFYFFSVYKDNKAQKETTGYNPVQFALQPQLFWNFLGTGAGGYGGTGIALRYRLVGGDAKKDPIMNLNNKFDVNFKWSF